ncbi:hypothetical protein SNE40_010159 [Patella caerulea]|uniref:Uncharacterized protein n=1 Tax=Patella caerulea TaxID=87958 RepID=A0AAN8JXD5_PATCE
MPPVTYTEKTRLNHDMAYHHRPFCIKNITIITRIVGLMTVTAMWVSAVLSIEDKQVYSYVGWYLLAASIVVTFLELLWLMDKCACCSRTGCCCTCWSFMLWFDTWKRGFLYILISIPMFLNGMRIYLSIICGFLLMFLAFLYTIKTFKHGIVYEVQETKVIHTDTTKVITHEISTQTMEP